MTICDRMPCGKTNRRKSRRAVHQLCCLFCFFIVQNRHRLPLASAQQIDSPSRTQCLAAPCTYRGECRSSSNVCGDTVAYCNANSIWVPGCGGGGGLDKPEPVVEAFSPPPPPPVPPPANWPAMQSPAVVPAPATPPANGPAMPSPAAIPLPAPAPAPFPPGEPTATPTTKWQLWTSTNNKQEEDEGNKGVAGLTTGKEGEGNYTASNDTGWFDPETWDGGAGEKEEGVIDKIDFWNNDNSALGPSKVRLAFLLTVVVAGTIASL
ncbi:hypothetical protein ACHAWF_006859 [Thalassiosira exigua]